MESASFNRFLVTIFISAISGGVAGVISKQENGPREGFRTAV
jgi:hypothetical protein